MISLVLPFSLAFSTICYGRILKVYDFPINETSAIDEFTYVSAPMRRYVVASNFSSLQPTRKVLSIPTLLNYGGFVLPVGQVAVKYMQRALDQLRKQPNWLPDYELVFDLIDDECSDATALPAIATKLRDNDEADSRLPFVVNSMCLTDTQKAVASMSKHLNLRTVVAHENDVELSSYRKRFSASFTMSAKGDEPQDSVFEFVKKMGWRKVAIISEINVYYDKLDNFLVRSVDSKNLDLLYLAKISDVLLVKPHPDEMYETFTQMAKYNPRIIISMSLSPVNIACWLYRTEMYGPDYVIFFYRYQYLYFLPEYIRFPEPWCTIKMTDAVLANAFLFGELFRSELMGEPTTEQTGLSWGDLFSDTEKHVIGASYFKNLMAPLYYYDSVIFMGYVLNTTETLLKKQGESLVDWTTDSFKFKTNPQFIGKVFDDAVYSTPVLGYGGMYAFNRSTMANTDGFMLMNMLQVQVDERGQRNLNLVGLYTTNQPDPWKIFKDRFVWRTYDKLQPPDAIQIIFVEEPLLKTDQIIPLFAIGVLGISLVVISISFPVYRRFFSGRLKEIHLASEEYVVLTGNALLFGQSLSLPYGIQGALLVNCYALSGLIVVGYSLVMIGIFSKISSGLPKRSASKRVESHTPAYYFKKYYGRFREKSIAVCLVWTALSAILIGFFFGFVGPLEIIRRDLYQARSMTSSSIEYHHYRMECSLELKFESALYLGAIAAVHVMLLCQMGMLSYRLILRSKELKKPKQVVVNVNGRSVTKTVNREPMKPEFLAASTCFYCELLVMLGGILVALLMKDERGYFTISITVLVQIFALLNMVILAIGKLKKTVVAAAPAASGPGSNPLAAHGA